MYFKYLPLYKEQEEALAQLFSKRDVFINLPTSYPAGKATSKRRQRMSSNRRRKRVENANGIDVENSTSFQRLEIDVVSTSGNRRRFNVEKSTSFQRL